MRVKFTSLLYISCAFFFLSLPLAGSAHAATYYSSPSGSGSTCSLASPCSLNTGTNRLAPGDTLYLRQGSYVQTWSVGVSGTAASPITISAYPGESAVIDGNYTLPVTLYFFLATVSGNYINVKNLEVTRSNQDAFIVTGAYDTITNVSVHDNMASGLIFMGSHDTADRVTIYNNSQDYAGCSFKAGYSRWGGAMSCGPGSTYGMIKNSVVYNNWGEGLSSYSSGNSISDHCTIQDNVSFNNGSVFLYLQNSTHDLVQRNLIYRTSDTPRACAANIGLQLGNESTGVCTSDSTIINNLVMGTYMTFNVDVCTFSGHLKNAVIANNTFVNAISKNGYNMGVYFRHYPTDNIFENTIFANNIIEQDDALIPIDVQASHPGLTFFNNLYNKTYMSSAVGAGDVIGNPALAKTGSYTAGQLTANWFQLTAASAALNKGSYLSSVTTDFFNFARGNPPDIGAIEYGSSGTVPTQPPVPPTPTAVAQPTSTPPPPFPSSTTAPFPTSTPTSAGCVAAGSSGCSGLYGTYCTYSNYAYCCIYANACYGLPPPAPISPTPAPSVTPPFSGCIVNTGTGCASPYANVCVYNGYHYCCSQSTTQCVGLPPPSVLSIYCDAAKTSIRTALGCLTIFGTPLGPLQAIMDLSTRISTGIALLLLGYAGLVMLTSQGNPKKVQLSKEIVVAVISGIILIALSLVLVNFIGVTVLHLGPLGFMIK